MPENKDIEGRQINWREEIRHVLTVFVRIATVPIVGVILFVTVYLAVQIYEFALTLDSNIDQLLAFTALFGGISFFASRGISYIRSQVVGLLSDFKTYLLSVFRRDAEIYRESIAAIMKRVFPILASAFVIGILGGYASVPEEAWQRLPDSITVISEADGSESIALNLNQEGGRSVSMEINGFRGTIRQTVMEVIDEDEQEEQPGDLEHVYNLGNWKPSNFVAKFPVVFERASLSTGIVFADEAASALSDYEFTNGVQYNSELNGELIEELIEALIPCGEEDGTRPVWLSVQGYASSAPFRDQEGAPRPDSDMLNVRVANERKQSVENALLAAIAAESAEDKIRLVSGHDYDNPDQLERDRMFIDRPDGDASELGSLAQDYLTRVAYINVLGAGKCALH